MKYKAIIFDLDFTLYNECDFLKEVVLLSNMFDNPENGINKITYRFRIEELLSKVVFGTIESSGNLDLRNHLDSVFELFSFNHLCQVIKAS